MERGEGKGVLVERPGGGREKQGVVGVEARGTWANWGSWDTMEKWQAGGADV